MTLTSLAFFFLVALFLGAVVAETTYGEVAWLIDKLQALLGWDKPSVHVGSDAIVGKRATVISSFMRDESGTVWGTVLVDGERWKAIGAEKLLSLVEGSEVTITSISGLEVRVIIAP